MKVGELIYQLTFEANTTKLGDFMKSISDLNMSSIMATTGLGGLINTAKELLVGTRDTAMEMQTFQNVTGMSAQQMKAWSLAAEQAGTKTGAVEDAIKSLQSSITNTKLGRVDNDLMQAYHLLNNYGKAGIDINDNLFNQLEKVRGGLQSMTPDAQRLVVQLMHMDESMLNFFKSSESVWGQRNNLKNVMDPEDLRRMMEMNAEWAKLGQELGNIGNKFATEISPVIIGTTRTLIELVKEIKDSWIGKALSMSAEGWGRIGEYTQAGLDALTMGGAKVANSMLKETPGWDVQGAGATAGAPLTVNTNNYISGNDVTAMHSAAKEAAKEGVLQAYHAAEKIAY